MRASTIAIATQKRVETARESDESLYRDIEEHPGLSTYELAKKMEWTIGKTNGTLQRLVNTKLIYHEAGIVDNRVKYSWHAYTAKELLGENEIKDLKKVGGKIKTYKEYLSAYE